MLRPVSDRQFVVMFGCRHQRHARSFCKFRDRHDHGEHRFENLALFDAQIDTQIVAASRFDPAYGRDEIFGAGKFQHLRAFDFHRAHVVCRISNPCTSQAFHNWKQCQRKSWRNPAYQRDITRIRSVGTEYGIQARILRVPFKFRADTSALLLRRGKVHRSLRVSCEFRALGRPVAANLDNSCNRFISRIRIGSVVRACIGGLPHHARNLAGRALRNPLAQPLFIAPGIASMKPNYVFKETGCKFGAQTPDQDRL
jgi:hypothetical protein